MNKKLYMAIADISVLKNETMPLHATNMVKKLNTESIANQVRSNFSPKAASTRPKKNEHQKSSVRAKVEHVFSVIKNLFFFRKTRYRGKRKQFAKLNFLFALANLYLADRRFGLSV